MIDTYKQNVKSAILSTILRLTDMYIKIGEYQGKNVLQKIDKAIP